MNGNKWIPEKSGGRYLRGYLYPELFIKYLTLNMHNSTFYNVLMLLKDSSF